MNEKKKIMILLSIVFVIVLVIMLGSLFEGSKSKKYLNNFYNDFNSNDNKLVMIGRSNCSWCQLFHPILDFMSEHYEFEFTYVDTNELTTSVFNKLLKDINVSSDDFGTPLTLVVRDGVVIDTLSGYADEEVLLDFLKDNGFVDKKANTVLNYIDYEGYKKLLKSKDTEILVIGQTTCGYCIKSKPILSQIAVDYDIDINFFNVNEIDNDDDMTDFEKSLSYYTENEWGTPLTLIIKNDEVLDAANGLLDYEGYVELFKDNGLIK